MKTPLKLITATSMLALLAGCSSLGGGHSNYSCEGIGDGEGLEGCMSVRDAYDATNDMATDKGGTPPTQNAIDNARHVAEAYVAPNLPDKAVPVRTPAEVMRIWVAPWENDTGDLIVSGYVYTEIEPRRWVLGSEPGGSNDRALKPLR